jgi:hypothetical protein
MADPLQPPLPQPPNWGAYVAGQDTLGYYYQQGADLAQIGVYYYSQKITNPQESIVHLASVIDNGGSTTPGIGKITGGQFRGDSTNGSKVAGQAFIPNALPGGVTP